MKWFSLQSFSAGVAVGILATTVWYFGGSYSFATPPAAVAQTPVTTVATSSTDQSDAVDVSDQSFGDSVLINSVTVPPPGVWVAVRDVTDVDNTLGNVLGAVKSGHPESNLSVPLLRATLPGHTYAVELYRDDGSGVFDPSLSVYVDFNTDQPVIEYFKTTQ